MSQRLPFFATFVRSFTGGAVYREAAAASSGQGFRYFFGLLAICVTLGGVGIYRQFTGFLDEVSRGIGRADIPQVTISNGRASSPVKQPWVREFDGGGVVIDTTGRTTSLPESWQSGLLLTRDSFIVRQKSGAGVRTDIHPVAAMPDVTVSRESLLGVLQTVHRWSLPVILVGYWIWCFFAKLIQAMLFAILGLVILSSKRTGATYSSAFNIALVALTPAFLMSVVQVLTGFNAPWMRMVYYALIAAYVIAGARAYQDTGEAPPASGEAAGLG